MDKDVVNIEKYDSEYKVYVERKCPYCNNRVYMQGRLHDTESKKTLGNYYCIKCHKLFQIETYFDYGKIMVSCKECVSDLTSEEIEKVKKGYPLEFKE